jgi:hypothetical protein
MVTTYTVEAEDRPFEEFQYGFSIWQETGNVYVQNNVDHSVLLPFLATDDNSHFQKH